MKEREVVSREEEKNQKKVYSHSRLWLYESCPESYKIKYIDKAFPDLPKSIELFLGDLVHQSLEWLYLELNEGREVGLDDFIKHFADNWHKNFSFSELRINGGRNSEFYFNKGIKFLADYYQRNKPFNDNTIDIEKRIVFPLDDNGFYNIQGYVDRIVKVDEKEFEVHDYKTNEFMKSQEQVDADRQLGFYHLGLQETFGREIDVRLVWHFLAHNRVISSKRTQEQLENLKKNTLQLIKRIESTQEWNACGKPWCDWCAYKKRNSLNFWINKSKSN